MVKRVTSLIVVLVLLMSCSAAASLAAYGETNYEALLDEALEDPAVYGAVEMGTELYLLYTEPESPVWILGSIERDSAYYLRQNSIHGYTDSYKYMISAYAGENTVMEGDWWYLPACLTDCVAYAFSATLGVSGFEADSYAWHPVAREETDMPTNIIVYGAPEEVFPGEEILYTWNVDSAHNINAITMQPTIHGLHGVVPELDYSLEIDPSSVIFVTENLEAAQEYIVAVGLGEYLDYYQPVASTPQPSRRFTKFITTNSGFFAIKPDGTVYTSNLEGEFGNYTLSEVEAWTDIVDIKWAWNGVMGLKTDGTVVYSGGAAMADAVRKWREVTAIECRSDCLYGLCADGTVYSVSEEGASHPEVDKWRGVSYITSYVCGSGEAPMAISEDGVVLHPYLSNYLEQYWWSGTNENIVSIDSSGWLNLAIKEDGTVICSGEDRPLVEDEISTWRDMKQVCAGDCMALGLRRDGTVAVAGDLPWLKELESWDGIDELYLADENKLVAGIKQDGSLIVAKEPENYNGSGNYDTLGKSGSGSIAQLGYIHNFGEDSKLIGITENGEFFVWDIF